MRPTPPSRCAHPPVHLCGIFDAGRATHAEDGFGAIAGHSRPGADLAIRKPVGLCRHQHPGAKPAYAYVTDGKVTVCMREDRYRELGYLPAFDLLPVKTERAAAESDVQGSVVEDVQSRGTPGEKRADNL